MAIYRYDDSFRTEGVRTVAGLDEAGRGPLAGPVVAAAVVLPRDLRITGLRDSKLVPEEERRRIFEDVICGAVDVGIGISDVDAIEKHNILGATMMAMEEAVADLSHSPDLLLIDAVSLPSVPIMQQSPVKGDSLSASIAAASIVAKVVRDALMVRYHGIYPEYGFDSHKGYGTRQHIDALEANGPCPLHRRSFRKVLSLRLPF